jgi:hypothetical protein
MANAKRARNPMLVRRQRYRLRATVKKSVLPICPDWVDHSGIYEGDIDPSSQDFHEFRIRLFCPNDPDMTFLVEEEILEEVD